MPAFLQVDEDYLNINAVELVEHVNNSECVVRFVSGEEETYEMSAAQLMREIERKEESLGNRY